MKWSGWSDFPIMENMRSAELRPSGEGRPKGLHLSHVIHHMKVAAGEKVGTIEGDQEGVRMQEGFLWETALEYMIAGMSLDEAIGLAFKRLMVSLRSDVATQIKTEKDGIHMTPDGMNKTLGELESYKCTRKSLAKALTQDEFESNHWPWIVQESSYCYALGIDTVHWVVLFQAGDYSKGRGTGPRCVQSTGVFTAEELASNWRVILTHAEGLRQKEK